MSDTAAADGPATGTDPVVPTSAGALLKAARERQGLHLAVLAASLKVTPRKLELLEADAHAQLPGPSFVRALALSMCRALKIDPEPVLAQLPRPSGQVLDHVAHGLNQPFRDRGAPGIGEPGEWPRWMNLPVIGAALLVAAAALVYLLPVGFWSSLRPGGADATPAVERSATAPAAAPATASTTTPTSAAPAASAVANSQGTSAAAEGGAARSAPVPAAAPASAVIDTVFLAPDDGTAGAGTGGLLSVRTSGESWIEVRDRSGQILLSRTLAAGETAALDGTPPLKVTVGNAEATELLFRGKPVPLSAARDNVARVELQ